jgi:hypothetical protein
MAEGPMLRRISLALLLTLSAATAAAGVRVAFIQPERFTDASLSGSFARGPDEPALSRLKVHLEGLGARHLRPDQVLSIEIVDVDLAGRMEWPRRFVGEVRVLRDIDAPHVVLRYSLDESGRVTLQGAEDVTDLNYRSRYNAYYRDDALRYEKALLDAWFRDRIVERRPQRR